MKTRAQIYSHEASGILRDIFTYGVLHRNRFWVYIHRRMSNVLCAMNTMDLQRYPENYELLSTAQSRSPAGCGIWSTASPPCRSMKI